MYTDIFARFIVIHSNVIKRSEISQKNFHKKNLLDFTYLYPTLRNVEERNFLKKGKE